MNRFLALFAFVVFAIFVGILAFEVPSPDLVIANHFVVTGGGIKTRHIEIRLPGNSGQVIQLPATQLGGWPCDTASAW